VIAPNDTSLAAGSIDITPERPLPLAGFVDRLGPSDGVNDPLEMNGLLLRAGGRAVAILTADLLFVTEPLKQQILAAIRPHLPLDEASLLFAASHTHTAPSVDPSKPRLGACDPDYVSLVARRSAELLRRLAAAPPVPCRLEYRSGIANHAINRRRPGWRLSVRHLPHRAVLRAPNPAGPRDETLHLLTFTDADDHARAVLWSYACHPVGFPAKARVSADYPGVARRALRAALGTDLPVLFLQGFAGDVRPRELGPPTTIPRRLVELVAGRLFTPFTEPQYGAWSGSLAQRAVEIARAGPAVQQPLTPACAHGRLALTRLVSGAPEVRTVTLQHMRLAPGLSIAAISAEPVADYASALRAQLGGVVLPVGYIDSVFGYLPTARMLGERGYEDSGFMEAFGLSGGFRPELERVVHDAWAGLEAAAPLA
jgi:hypothetical protein